MNHSIETRPFSFPAGLLVAVVVLVALLSGPAHSDDTRWTCSMHPQIILPDNHQQCPICFMDLIPLADETGAGLAPNELSLSNAAVALAEIEVRKVQRARAHRTIRLVGKVAPDQTRVSTITARFEGRLDHLNVDAVGLAVRPGMKLAEIYSPELYSAQVELRSAASAAAFSASSEAEIMPGASSSLASETLKSVTSRLRLWGLSHDDIQGILESEENQDHWPVIARTGGVVTSMPVARGDYVRTGSVLYTIADLSSVWVVLEAWESDVAWLRPGQTVRFSVRAHPGRSFEGRILFIEPVLDERSRTVAVRVEVENSDGWLKPGMLVSAAAEVPLGERDALLIPASAPLLTGDRAVVYVRRPGGDEPVFAGREVVLGTRAGDQYVVMEGLVEGEDVVTRGNFKIDSALQIMAKPSMMNPSPRGDELVGHSHHGDWSDQEILADYFALQTALAGDDDVAAATAARSLNGSLGKLDFSLEPATEEGSGAWTRRLATLRAEASRLATATDIASRRLAFQPLSDDLWLTLDEFGSSSGQSIRRFHCPMAMDGAGANWIQSGKTTANPYYGAMMLRCGSQVGILEPGGDQEER